MVSPVCKLTVNKAGLLTLSIPPMHPYTDKLKKLDTILSLWQDDALLFRGRILNDEYDLYGMRKLEAEGELAYLNDSIQPLAVYHDMTVSGYFTQLLEIHNAQVEEDRRFVPGQVTVEDSNDSLYRQSNYENTLDAMLDKLVDRLGGYLVVRYDTNGTRYLDCLKEYGNVNSQRITARTICLIFCTRSAARTWRPRSSPSAPSSRMQKMSAQLSPVSPSKLQTTVKTTSLMKKPSPSGVGFGRSSFMMTSRLWKISWPQATRTWTLQNISWAVSKPMRLTCI